MQQINSVCLFQRLNTALVKTTIKQFYGTNDTSKCNISQVNICISIRPTQFCLFSSVVFQWNREVSHQIKYGVSNNSSQRNAILHLLYLISIHPETLRIAAREILFTFSEHLTSR